MRLTREKDGRSWRIGTSADVQWIADGTTRTRDISTAIPPLFDAYATLVLPRNLGSVTETRHYQAVISILTTHSEGQPWWLGYLETGLTSDVVFFDVPKVKLYFGWDYVLVEAGPEQAANWRSDPRDYKGPLPDLMFPADRSWLFSTLWDDDWSCIGGSEQLVADFERHQAFQLPLDPGRRVHRVPLGVDPTPPGHGRR